MQRKTKIIESIDGEIFDIELSEDLLKKNKEIARENKKLLEKHNILGIDIMGAIGAGKTTLITKIVSILSKKYKIAVLCGDLTTTLDADIIKSAGAEVIQINTGKECHLDANLVRKALKELSLNKIDLLIIENVGNLICPGEFVLGTHKRMVVVSVTEGPFMVVKHPYIFMEADVGVINKIELKDVMDVEPKKLQSAMKKIKPGIKVFETSARKNIGVEILATFISKLLK
ncbi:MAG: hydrogenase nickel incorporation protein HypB [bacterium]|nr:hydrogenase nickel incorporation protein HypB [bacterium]